MTKLTYCSKSWTDVNIDFENRILRHCCKASEYNFPQVLTSEFIGLSEEIRRRRQQTLENIEHKDCAVCWNDYNKSGTAYRDWANEWTDPFVEIRKNQLDTDKYIHYIEIKTDTTCDMACLYCNANSSSKIAQEEGRIIINKTDENDYKVFKDWIRDHISSKLTPKLLLFIFLGGEPTASDRFHELADYIEDLAVTTDKKIRLEICTNANSKKFLMDKIIARMDASRITWGIGISNESFGEDAELIRHGLNWQRFQENFVRYISHPKTELIVLSPTVNIFNLKSFHRYMDWVHEQFRTHAPDKEFTWYGNYISWPDQLDISRLPASYSVYLDLLENSFQKNRKDKNYVYQNSFEEYIKKMKQRLGIAYDPDYKLKAEEFLLKKQQVKKTDKLIKLMNNLDL